MAGKLWESVEPWEDKTLANDVVARRRRVISPVPGLSLSASFAVQRDLFSSWGLDAYANCVSAEMSSRPTPHVSAYDERMHALTSLCEKYLPVLFAHLNTQLSPPVQTYNKVSRMGWPYFNRPESKAAQALWSYVRARDSPEYLKDCFTTANVRLQPEPERKVRRMQFISDDGVVEEREVEGADRTLWVQELGQECLAMRTRLVFNKPAPNLALQIVDTAINNVWGVTGACHHDMYSPTPPMIRRYKMAVDVSHMERFTAAMIGLRTSMIGGEYEAQHDAMDAGGFLVPSSTWKRWFRIKRPAAGLLLQFGSGHSAVAPSQKEALLCVLIALHHERWGMRMADAVAQVLSGNTAFLHIMNFGDDNFWSSDSAKNLEEALDFAKRFLHCEVEDPPRFLGFTYTEGAGFKLSAHSYLLKTYLNERAPLSTFRKYPFFGWVEKRKTYLQYGDPRTMGKVFAQEDDLLQRMGLAWEYVQKRADEERRALGALASKMTVNALFGKDYLMTAEEKLESGAFDGIGPEVTGPLLREMVSSSFLSL